MIYLIQHQAWWLLFAVAFAGLAGWAWYGMRVRARIEAAARERDRLMRELVNIGVELSGSNGISPELERELDTSRRRADLSAAHAAEMERALEAARSRAEEATGRIAELERALERSDFDGDDYRRLRDEAAERQHLTVDVESEPAPPAAAAPTPAGDDMAQAWRLRYFEQRVRYLENNNHKPNAAPSVEAQRLEWRARLAEAQVRHLEQELRLKKPVTLTDAPAPVPDGEDPLLHWRRLYLEKRLAHMRDAPVAQAAAAMPAQDHEAEVAKWRARYLELRLRSAEARLTVVPTPHPVEEARCARRRSRSAAIGRSRRGRRRADRRSSAATAADGLGRAACDAPGRPQRRTGRLPADREHQRDPAERALCARCLSL